MCLLHVLLDLAPRWDLRMSVLHLNHNLRGEESGRDAEFVRETADRLGLPVRIGEWSRYSAGGADDNLE